MRRAQLLDYSLLSSVTNNKYINTDNNSNSYGTEPIVFNSNANSNADSNADYNADSGINYNANSITRSNNTYEAPA